MQPHHPNDRGREHLHYNMLPAGKARSKMKKITIADAIRNTAARSAWKRGVKAYALELLDNLPDTITTDDTAASLRAAMLNGAQNWTEYSWGGLSLIYNGDVAERLCTSSELRKTRHGDRRPNAREQWLDTQARALYQAEWLIIHTINGIAN